MTPRRLGHRALQAYYRIARDLAAFNYVTRHAKPSGGANETSLRSLNRLIHAMNRLLRREAGIMRLTNFDPIESMSALDFSLAVARLTSALMAFAERYIDPETIPPPAYVSRDGLPSPHA